MSNKLNIIKTRNILGEAQYDSIQFRTGFIKDLLKDKKLEMMVNFDNDSTENFIYPSNYKSLDSDSVQFT